MNEQPAPDRLRRTLRRSAIAVGAAAVAAGVVLGGSMATFGVYRSVTELAVSADTGPVGSGDAADAAVSLSGSPTFLREALRALPAPIAADLEAELSPATIGGALARLLPRPPVANPTERQLAALGDALTTERTPDGRSIVVTVAAYQPMIASAAAAAVVKAYDASGAVTTGTLIEQPGRFGPSPLAWVGAALAALVAAGGVLLPSLWRSRGIRRQRERVPGPPVAGALECDLRLAGEGGDAAADAAWSRLSAGAGLARCILVCTTGDVVRSRYAASRLAGAPVIGEGPTVIVDLTHPHIAEAEPGFSALIDGAASFSEVIHRGVGRREHVIIGDGGILALEPVVRRERLAAVIEALVLTYDHVVVHIDPVSVPRLAEVLRAHADGIVVVVDKAGCGPEARAVHEAVRDGRLPVLVAAVELPGRSGTPTFDRIGETESVAA